MQLRDAREKTRSCTDSSNEVADTQKSIRLRSRATRKLKPCSLVTKKVRAPMGTGLHEIRKREHRDLKEHPLAQLSLARLSNPNSFHVKHHNVARAASNSTATSSWKVHRDACSESRPASRIRPVFQFNTTKWRACGPNAVSVAGAARWRRRQLDCEFGVQSSKDGERHVGNGREIS